MKLNHQSIQSIHTWIEDTVEILTLSIRLQVGHRYWFLPLLTLLWPLFVSLQVMLGWQSGSFSPIDAQTFLIGLPMTILAIGLGIQVISSEIEERTLEVCYTVPGGASRIWLSKLFSITCVLVVAEALLALYTALFFTSFPISALYGALQGALFYLVLGMSLGAILRNKLTAGMASIALLFFNGAITDFGSNPIRYSPIFNPISLENTNMATIDILTWTIQNRIGFALLMIIIIILSFSRAERRELLLSGD